MNTINEKIEKEQNLKWNLLNEVIEHYYEEKGYKKPEKYEYINSLTEAIEFFNYVLNKGFFFGTDYYNGWNFGNITSIENRNENLVIAPDDLRKKETHFFKFKSLLIVYHPKEKKLSPSIFIETERTDIEDKHKKFFVEENKKGKSHFYNHLVIDKTYSEEEYLTEIEYGDCSAEQFNSECHFYANGISVFLNVQGLKHIKGSSFLNELQEKNPFLTNKELILNL